MLILENEIDDSHIQNDKQIEIISEMMTTYAVIDSGCLSLRTLLEN